MKHPRSLLSVLLVPALFTASALAQSTATVSGVVTDPSGAVVPNAQVKVHSIGTGLDRTVQTDGAGLYVVPSIQPGDYTIDASAAGFAATHIDKVSVEVDQHLTVNVHLTVGSTAETIQVESSTISQIETETMTVGQVIDRNTVQELPLNGRHFLDMTVLTPGGVVAPTAGNLTSPSRGLGANSFITAGNREDSVNFQINGVNLNDMAQNQITFQPSINTTSEVKIDNSTFSAEYGRSSGSIVNVSTRSGTNQFHGEAFDYFRNEALDARWYFNRPFNVTTGAPLGYPGRKAPFKRNNFGGALGGPIFHDRTFFFASYEGLRQHQGLLQNGTVLSNAPYTVTAANGVTTYYPNQRAAVQALNNPAANALLSIIPLPNSGNNYVSFTPGPVQIDQGTMDVLQNLRGGSDTVHGFYAFQADTRIEPNLQGNTIPGFGDHRNAHRQILTINEIHTFSPTFVNEARIGFNRISIGFFPSFTPDPLQQFHIGSGVSGNVGIPQITISDINLNFGGPSTFPQGRVDTLGVLSDTATLLRGKHTLKIGGEFRRFLNAGYTGDIGAMTYGTSELGSTISAADAQAKSQAACKAGSPCANQFANDLAQTFTIQPTTVSSRVYVNAVGAFVQDNYKPTPNLTLEAGLRFEWNGTPVEGANRFVVFRPGPSNTGYLYRVGTNGIDSPYKQNYDVEPRLGFAYDFQGKGRTVIRGGFSLLTDQPASNAVGGLSTNPPFNTGVTYSNANSPQPVGTIYNSTAGSSLSIADINPNFRNAYTETYNLNVQQAIPGGLVGSIGYYGSVGRHLRARTNENQPVIGSTTRPFKSIAADSPIQPNANISTANIAEANSVGSSNYNGLWLTLSKAMTHGVELNVNYEWMKSMDTNSLGSQGVYTFQDSTNPAGNYGPSDFDVRHHFAGIVIYALPFKSNRFVSGFRLNTVIQYQTGNPINILESALTTTGVTSVIRPNWAGKPHTSKTLLANGNIGFMPASEVCNPGVVTPGCAFQIQLSGIGNAQRNPVYGPGFADVDLSGEKETKVTETITFTLRADAFDIFNHPNFAQPNGNVQATTFGQITNTRFPIGDAGSSRQLQISGKIRF